MPSVNDRSASKTKDTNGAWEFPLSKEEREKRITLTYKDELEVQNEEKKIDESTIHNLKQLNDQLEFEKGQLISEVIKRNGINIL